MIEALLYAVRNAIRDPAAGLGYDYRSCDLTGTDGKPPQRCGDVFVSVFQGGIRSTMQNALNELMDFSLTLTMRASNVPRDRIGDQLLCKKLAKELGFNKRCHKLKSFLHMNWSVLQDANTILVDMADPEIVYGFCEPARFASMEQPHWVYGDWFGADPEAADVGLAAQLDFADCRRLQPIGGYT